MKTSGIVVTIVLGVFALGLTVWIGRYKAEPEVLIPRTASSMPPVAGPKVSETGPHPKAVPDSTEHNFGIMALGNKGEHRFTIKNEGEADLKMEKGASTCQCTLGELGEGDTIPPGESRSVTLTWEIKVLVENFRHSAKILTNDPDNRVLDFVVTGRVDQRFSVAPGAIWEVGELSQTEPTSVTGWVFSRTNDKFALHSPKTSKDQITVTLEPMTPEALAEKGAKSGYQVRAEVAAGAPIGPYSESFSLMTDDETTKTIDIKLQGHHAGPIEFLGPAYRKETSQISFGEFSASEGKEITLSVFVRDFDEDLQLLSVDPPSDRVQFELVKDEKLTGKTKRYRLKVKVLPGPQLDVVAGSPLKFELKFNHPEAPAAVMNVRMLAI